LKKDVVELSKPEFDLPTPEKCNEILKRNNLSSVRVRGQELDTPYLNDNNKIFLEPLEKMFDPKSGEKNEQLEKMLVYLEDINHSSFKNKEEFLSKFVNDVKEVEQMTTNEGKQLYGDKWYGDIYSKKAYLEAKHNRPERYQELTDLYKLYKEEKVPRYLLDILFPKASFHKLPKQDMEKLLKGENYFPQFTDAIKKDEILKLKTGEVFQKEKNMYVRTKNGYEKLNIDEETYRKLFPPVERYAIAQNRAGNCGKISAINAMIKHPETRVDLYRTLEQTPSGVKVSMPNLGVHEFNYNNLEMLNTENNLQGGLGHKMIEYAHDFKKYGHLDTAGNPRPNIVEDLTGHTNNPDLAKSYGWSQMANNLDIEKTVNRHQSGIYTFNGCAEIPNSGITDGHYYSATKLPVKNSAIQNPWNGIESIPYEKEYIPNCYDGTLINV